LVDTLKRETVAGEKLEEQKLDAFERLQLELAGE
jgi:hypothetical protein